MNTFPGATRRRWLVLPTGNKAHGVAFVKVATGPSTFCGKLGGSLVAWSAARERDLCGICARKMGMGA